MGSCKYGNTLGNREWLEDYYVRQQFTVKEIGRSLGVDPKTVKYWLNKYHIHIRGLRETWDIPRFRNKKREAMSGKNHHRWKGGRMNRKGRIYVLAKNHPHANRDGYVPESRRIVERALGRYLKPSEVVHHINQDKRDNRNTNLLVCSNQYHSWLHGKGMSEQTRMKLSEISKALWRNSEYRKKHKRLHREP